jgi:hypothetical protein
MREEKVTEVVSENLHHFQQLREWRTMGEVALHQELYLCHSF